ncbi:UpxZ family transcription anti-terminator antagonist [Bacteroides oleiciplenus]|uniref:Transcriptional regulator n=1 Tax=Bacteroides oleiciplenus TaxID=626931 RepID=A0A3E5BCJ9_9BACE|nr:UpxZ family transcription anti-terminator antagonist [Bacteroides oleiciplenus]RGN35284.1 transcriptional regulator [Bacteroides oleiciplenus]
MNSLLSRALELQHAAHELMYLGMDGEPIYSDTFCRLNKELLVKADSLFSSRSSNIEEEANLCLALLMGYNATIYDYGDKGQKKQAVLDRIYNVLEELPDSLLKVRLLTYTYGEVYEESMLQEAHSIIDNWNTSALTIEQIGTMEELKNIEENPYPFEVI